MPHTFEFLPNQIRLDLSLIFNQFCEILHSGLFALKKIAPISKGQCSFIFSAVYEQSLEWISILVDKSAIIKITLNPITIEFRVATCLFINHGANAMRLIKCTLTLISPFYSIDSLGLNAQDFLYLSYLSLFLINCKLFFNKGRISPLKLILLSF